MDPELPKFAVVDYCAPNGAVPFRAWVSALKDKVARAVVLARVDRLSFGSFGDWKSIGAGVFELRVHFGKGYRVYFGRKGNVVVVLLCGGDKATQERDIDRAKKYWKDHEARS